MTWFTGLTKRMAASLRGRKLRQARTSCSRPSLPGSTRADTDGVCVVGFITGSGFLPKGQMFLPWLLRFAADSASRRTGRRDETVSLRLSFPGKRYDVMKMLEWVAYLLCRPLLKVLPWIANSPTQVWILSRFTADPSQNGEARILQMAREVLATRGKPVPATFLECGANHPFRLSNTWHLENQGGFTGVSVDPLPE